MAELLTVRQTAEALGVSPSTIRRWSREGLLTSVRTLGGHRRFSVADVQRLKNPQNEGVSFPQPNRGL